MENYKVEWQQVPSWMRFGLRIARVQKPLVTSGELSPNEMENLAKFGYVCVAVTLLAIAEVYCFLHYALGTKTLLSYALSAVWGVLVFNADRSLFRDKLDKAKIRIAIIIVATFVFSLGFSVLISDTPLTNTITEENRKSNENIDKSLQANMQPYQDRLDKALQDQSSIGQDIAKNTNTSEAIKQATSVQTQAAQFAGDTTSNGKRNFKLANNTLYTITKGMKQQELSETSLKKIAEQNVKVAKIELDSQKVRYQQAYNNQRQPPDYSESKKTLTLLHNFVDVGWLHIFVLIFIAFIESFPLLMRMVYRDYDAVQLMIGLGNTPMNKIKERIKTIRDDIEKAKLQMAEEASNGQNRTNTNESKENPFDEIF